jgi:hypothetical protein
MTVELLDLKERARSHARANMTAFGARDALTLALGVALAKEVPWRGYGPFDSPFQRALREEWEMAYIDATLELLEAQGWGERREGTR